MATALITRARALFGASTMLALAAALPAQAETPPPVSVAPVPAAAAAAPGTLVIKADTAGPVINRDLFGQFAEHLGQGIYPGIWVGKTSKIPNVRGIRSDVVDALKALKVPVVRWPGGCYADKYHWRDGIGAKRRPGLNPTWGGSVEPQTFGTHEYMDFIKQIGAESYISVNMGSGTVQEAADWMEYMTTDQPTTLGKERVANGQAKPWTIKYLGMGNEMWGCGGAMSADNYVEHMKQYVMHVNSQNPLQKNKDFFTQNPLGAKRIAVGDHSEGHDYTEAIMKAWKTRMPWFWTIEGISMHHYTWGEAMLNAKPYDFTEKEYAGLLHETYEMDKLIAHRSQIMDKYDPGKKVALVVDEWGVWLKPEPGLNAFFLKQQTSMRDAVAAAINLNIFARHAARVRMANIAQLANVLQGMVLTDGAKMLLTPTYHVFRMYVPFQDATFIPVNFTAGEYKFGKYTMPQTDVIAARAKDGKVWLALANLDANKSADITASVEGLSASSAVGEVLTSPKFDSINTFALPNTVAPKPFAAKAKDGVLTMTLPPHSVTVVRLEP